MGRPVILEKYPYTYLRTIIMKKNLLKRADYDKILKMTFNIKICQDLALANYTKFPQFPPLLKPQRTQRTQRGFIITVSFLEKSSIKTLLCALRALCGSLSH